jgi:hypothetical protein
MTTSVAIIIMREIITREERRRRARDKIEVDCETQ